MPDIQFSRAEFEDAARALVAKYSNESSSSLSSADLLGPHVNASGWKWAEHQVIRTFIPFKNQTTLIDGFFWSRDRDICRNWDCDEDSDSRTSTTTMLAAVLSWSPCLFSSQPTSSRTALFKSKTNKTSTRTAVNDIAQSTSSSYIPRLIAYLRST
jgi:hypothetical protein